VQAGEDRCGRSLGWPLFCARTRYRRRHGSRRLGARGLPVTTRLRSVAALRDGRPQRHMGHLPSRHGRVARQSGRPDTATKAGRRLQSAGAAKARNIAALHGRAQTACSQRPVDQSFIWRQDHADNRLQGSSRGGGTHPLAALHPSCASWRMGVRGFALRIVFQPVLACRSSLSAADGSVDCSHEQLGFFLADLSRSRHGQARL